jgi:hypothetical protein
MGLREVKTELNKMGKQKLIKVIAEIYKKYKPVKEYLDFYVNPNEKELLEEYKDKVTEGFFPSRGYNFKLSLSRKAISDFKKLSTSPEALADLLLHYVECGVEFTNSYGDIDEAFYTRVENTYDDALKLMHKEDILKKFKKRAEKIVDDTTDIGWGFHDYLSELYYDFYAD